MGGGFPYSIATPIDVKDQVEPHSGNALISYEAAFLFH
jgi:hypothetical protein